MNMDELKGSEATSFVVEGELDTLVQTVIDSHLRDKQYDEELVQHWVNFICEDIMLGLAKIGKPFKYMVNCFIMQNNGAGVQTAVSEYVDASQDGMCVLRWPLERNRDASNILCIVSIFGISLLPTN